MNKYTPELIEEYAKAAEGFNEPTIGRMLRDYATLLRERESAKATVTDEIVHAALTEYYGGEPHPNCTPSMRAALEAVAPMLAGARVPERKPLPNLLLAQYHEAVGWNACRNAMLAAAPKPKKE